jgi:hypothetical protein
MVRAIHDRGSGPGDLGLSSAAIAGALVTAQLLLIVRERLRQSMEDAYDENERAIADVFASLQCPHPYLALASLDAPKEVWWLNAFASNEEKDAVQAAYAANRTLMQKLQPLSQRKEEFRDAMTTTLTEYRGQLSGTDLRIDGARFFAVRIGHSLQKTEAAVFASAAGEQFALAPAKTRDDAERISGTLGAAALSLAVQPQWSFPHPSWIAADTEFWRERSGR